MKKSGAGGIQHVMPSFCLLTAATLPIHPVLAICLLKISTRASFISISVNLSILSTAVNLFRARKNAVEEGKIAASRYESYLAILDEIKLLKEKSGKR